MHGYFIDKVFLTMKRKFFSVVMATLLGVLTCFANSSLIIHLADGSDVVYNLSDEPQMSFGKNTITLSTHEGTVKQWNFTDVESWYFDNVEDPDAINEAKTEKNQIKIEEGKLITNAKNVAIYDTNGRQVKISYFIAEKSSGINLNGLSNGTYLLKLDNSCIKFMVK